MSNRIGRFYADTYRPERIKPKPPEMLLRMPVFPKDPPALVLLVQAAMQMQAGKER